MKLSQEKEKFLGTEKIGKLLTKMSIPAIIAMLVNALYNVIDAVFLGHKVGHNAIGGLTIAFPFQMLIVAFAFMFGTGAASVISRKLGAGEKETANKAASNTIFLSLVFSLLIIIPGYLFLDNILRVFGASAALLPYTREYMSVILTGTFFITTAMSLNNVIRAEGQAAFAMLTMMIGTVSNIVLDYIFIYPLNMGIKGAAVATVIAQILSFLFIIYYFSSGKSTLKIKFSYFKPEFKLLKEIISLGIPALARQGGMSIILVIMNNQLGKYGSDLYISIFGIGFRILHFVLMPLFGLVQGVQPIAGYNYGAKNYQRVKAVVKLAITVSTIIAGVSFVIIMLFPGKLLQIFTSDNTLISAGIPVLRIVVLIIPLLGIQIIGSIYFQAIGKAIPAFILGLSRQFILLLPIVLLLPPLFGLWGVFLSFPITDFFATLLTGIWLLIDLKNLDKE